MYKQVLFILLCCLSFSIYAQQYKANWKHPPTRLCVDGNGMVCERLNKKTTYRV